MVLTPMPTASEATTTADTTGMRRSDRAAWRRSSSSEVSGTLPPVNRREDAVQSAAPAMVGDEHGSQHDNRGDDDESFRAHDAAVWQVRAEPALNAVVQVAFRPTWIIRAQEP